MLDDQSKPRYTGIEQAELYDAAIELLKDLTKAQRSWYDRQGRSDSFLRAATYLAARALCIKIHPAELTTVEGLITLEDMAVELANGLTTTRMEDVQKGPVMIPPESNSAWKPLPRKAFDIAIEDRQPKRFVRLHCFSYAEAVELAHSQSLYTGKCVDVRKNPVSQSWIVSIPQ